MGEFRAVSFSDQKEVFCRGSARVPAPNPKGATTGGLPLQENEIALALIVIGMEIK